MVSKRKKARKEPNEGLQMSLFGKISIFVETADMGKPAAADNRTTRDKLADVILELETLSSEEYRDAIEHVVMRRGVGITNLCMKLHGLLYRAANRHIKRGGEV